jgi:hypothetical protein
VDLLSGGQVNLRWCDLALSSGHNIQPYLDTREQSFQVASSLDFLELW